MNRVSEVLRDSRANVEKLSAKTGIAVERLRAMMAGGVEPTVGELRRLAVALRLSMVDFAPRNDDAEREADLLFRRAPVAGKPVSSLQVDLLSKKMASSFELLQSIKSGPAWLSQFSDGDDSLQKAEKNASIFRRVFCGDDQLSPLLSLPKVAVEKMGVMLFVIHSNDLDGASAYFEGVPFIFVAARFQPRMLFTVAHELGHITAHQDPTTSFAVIDQTTDREDEPNASTQSYYEAYADAFASALLMPSISVGLALKKIREVAKIEHDELGDLEIGYLARIFGVSFWAAARRCEDLSLLPGGSAASLNERIKKDFGSAEKRADAAGLPPRPNIEFPSVPQPLLASAVSQVRAGEMSIGRAATVLGLSISDLLSANISTVH